MSFIRLLSIEHGKPSNHHRRRVWEAQTVDLWRRCAQLCVDRAERCLVGCPGDRQQTKEATIGPELTPHRTFVTRDRTVHKSNWGLVQWNSLYAIRLGSYSLEMLLNEAAHNLSGTDQVDAWGLPFQLSVEFHVYHSIRLQVAIGMSLKPCSPHMLILELPCLDSTATRRLSRIISNFNTFLRQFMRKFSNFISVHTNSFGEEVIDLWLNHLILLTEFIAAWHVIFLSLWKDFGARFDGIINSLKEHRDFVDIEATSLDIVEARESRKRLQDDVRERRKRELETLEENETNARISRLQHSIAWLSCDEKFQEIEYERILDKRHDGTCEWVVNNLDLKSWMKDDARNQCLWLNGKPGSGTFLLSAEIV